MELLFKYLCFATFLHAAFSELGDGTGEDILFDIFSRRLDYISITLARIGRKQKVIEARLNDKTTDINEPQRNLETNSDITKRWLEDELAIIKKAISSEKQLVRSLVGSLESGTKAAIQTMSKGLENRVESLEKKAVDLTICSDLQSKVESMEGTLEDKIESVEKNLETTSNDIESRVNVVESSVSSLILASDKKVSFSVQYRSSTERVTTRFKKQRTIKFNHVFYNEGSGYNETTGIFTVPVSGVYQFIFFVEGWKGKGDFTCYAAIVILYVDGNPATTAAFADPRHNGQHIQAGNAYINYFRKGQEVHVQTSNNCDEYIISGYRTTFNGVLLY